MKRLRLILLASASISSVAAADTINTSSSPTVVAGDATYSVNEAGTVRTITQTTDRVFLDWVDLSVGENETLQFVQPDAFSIALNRVTGTTQTIIDGAIEANGRVWILNPNGIFISPTGQVTASGFLASTGSISSTDFMAGGDQFSIGGVSSASVKNAGSIATELGYTILHGASITNEGQISATLGAVLLASGNDLSISFDEGNLISYAVSNESTLAASFQGIKNTGTITADGGLIALSMASALDAIHGVINAEGLLQANSVEERNGTIILDAGDHGDLVITGTVTVAGLEADEVGGSIDASGALITVTDTAEVIADGGAGGGSISIVSTATQGSNSSTTSEGNSFVSISESEAFLVEETRIQLANGALADIAIVDGSVISASATVSGSGGTVTIEAPGEEELATFVAGEIRANGVGTDSVGGIIDLSGFYLEIEGSELSVSGATAGTVVLTAASIDLVDQLSAASTNLSFSDFEWQSAETTPLYDPALMTSLNLGDDQVSDRISLGFAFEFFGETYDSVAVSSNGFLSFGDLGSNSRCCNGRPLDGGNVPLLSIFGLWTDLIPNYQGGDVLYATITNPDGTREFILQWNAVSEYINGQLNTFEIRLRENGDIYLNYGDVSIVQHNVSIGLTGADSSQIAQLTYRELDFDNCCTTNIISDISQTAYIFSQGFDPVSQISAATLQNILGSGANLTINARNFTEANRSNNSIGNISVSGPLTLSFGANSSAQEIIFSADNNVSIDSSAVFSNFLGQLRLIAGASDGGQIGSVFAQGLINAGLLEVTGSVIQIGEAEAEEIILNVGGEATLGDVTAGTLTSTGLVNLGGSNSTLENLRILSGRVNLSEISGLPSETIYFGNGTLNIANTSLLELDQLVTVDEFGEIIFGASGAFSGSVDALSENTGNLRIASVSDLTISGSIGTNRTLEIIDFSSEGDLELTETARLVSDEFIGFFADGDIFIDSDEVIGSQFGGELRISADQDGDGTGGNINLVSSLSAGALEVSGNLVFDGSGEISVLNNSNINGSISTISEEEGVELTLRSAGPFLSVNGSIVFDQLNLETPGIGGILVSGDITATTLTKLGSGFARIQGPNSSINNLRIINGVLAISDISNLPLDSIFFGNGQLDIDIHEPETVDFSESQSVSETDFGPITLTQQITVEESGDILFRGSGIVSGAVNSVEEGVGSFNVSALGDLTITGQIGLEQSLHAATFYSEGDLSFADSARLRAEEFVGLFAHGNISLGSDDILASDYTGQLNLEADQDGDGVGGTINLVESLSAGSIFVSGDLLFSGSGQVTSLSNLIINGDISSEEEDEPTTLVLSSPGDLRVSGSITFNDVTVDTLNTGDAWFLGDLTAETLSKLGQGFLRLSGTNSAINHLRIINGALAISNLSNLPLNTLFFGNAKLFIETEEPVELTQDITVGDYARILFNGSGTMTGPVNAENDGEGILEIGAQGDLNFNGTIGADSRLAEIFADSGRRLTLGENAFLSARQIIDLIGVSGFTNLSEREDVLETGAWTVWSGNPDPFGEDNPDIVGSLVHDFRYYGISLAGARGEEELPERPEGNGLAYGLSPVLNAELAEELSRIYDGTTTFSPDLVSLLFSGLINGDSAIIDIVSATANLPGVDATEAVIAGITANFTDTSGAPVFGYRFQDTITVPAVILPATLTYRADEATRYVGAQNPTFSGTVTGFITGENLENATTGTLVFTSPADENSDVGLYPIFGGGLSAANYIFVQAVENETALTVQKNIINEVSSGSNSGSGGSGDGSGDTGSDGGGEGSGDGGSDDSGDGSGDGSEGSGDSGSDEGGDGSEEGGDDAGDSNSDDSDDGSDEGDQGSEDSDESSDEGSEESDEGSEDSDESSDEGSEESDEGSDDAGEGSEESSSDEGSDGSDSTDTSDGAGSDSEADTDADGGTSQQSGGEIVKVEVKPADPLPPSPVGDEPTPTPSDPEDSGDPVLAAVSFEDEASIDTSVGVPQEVVALTPTISVAPQKEAPPAPKSDDEALSINSALNP